MENRLLTKGAELLGLKTKPEDPFAEDEACRAASAVLVDLQLQEKENDERITELVEGLQAPSRDVLDDRARRLIDGKNSSPTDEEKIRRDLGGAYDRRVVLRRAIEMQRGRISTERERVSHEVCRKLRPEHMQLVRRLATQLIELGKTVVAEIEFRERLRAAGVFFTADLRPMAVSNLGDPREPYSAIAQYLRREALAYEFIGRDEVPAEWLKQWER